MKILYDGFIFAEQTAGGINRYFNHLIEELPPCFEPSLLTIDTKNPPQNKRHNLKTYAFRRLRPTRISLKFENLYFSFAAKRKFDLVHPTYYQRLNWATSKSVPVVITVYDMIHEIFADSIDSHGLHQAAKRRAIESANHIICISESTKRDLLERYPMPEEKVTITPLAASLSIGMINLSDASVPSRPYFLFVGARYAAYKNFDGLLRSFAKLISSLKNTKRELCLCVVGAPFYPEEKRLIADLKLEDYITHAGTTDDAHLAKLYHHSLALIYPSLYEGFGIPLLEAMACETAVIAADTSSIPEVTQGAALLFNPKKEDELVEAMRELFDNASLREKLIDKGKLQVEKFSWDKTVKQTVDIYRSVAASAK